MDKKFIYVLSVDKGQDITPSAMVSKIFLWILMTWIQIECELLLWVSPWMIVDDYVLFLISHNLQWRYMQEVWDWYKHICTLCSTGLLNGYYCYLASLRFVSNGMHGVCTVFLLLPGFAAGFSSFLPYAKKHTDRFVVGVWNGPLVCMWQIRELGYDPIGDWSKW